MADSVKKWVSTSSHGGMVAVVSNDYAGTYVRYSDYAALTAELEALRRDAEKSRELLADAVSYIGNEYPLIKTAVYQHLNAARQQEATHADK